MLRQIRPCTDPILKTVSEPVTEFTWGLHDLIRDLRATMKAAGGAGIAAIQVGVPKRVCLVQTIDGRCQAMINPTITKASEEMLSLKEGCLSMPGVFFEVDRHSEVEVTYLDQDEVKKTETFTGYRSVCVQHEIDHLDGIRNVDRLSPLKRSMAMKRYEKHVKEMRRTAGKFDHNQRARISAALTPTSTMPCDTSLIANSTVSVGTSFP